MPVQKSTVGGTGQGTPSPKLVSFDSAASLLNGGAGESSDATPRLRKRFGVSSKK